jgi:hypothetical protein
MIELAAVLVSTGTCGVLAASFLGLTFVGEKSNLKGADRALARIQAWSKWMATIQVAALAGLAKLLADADPRSWVTAFAAASFIFTGAALFCSSFVLAGVASLTIRIHSPGHADFDVFELPIYPARSPVLGNVMRLQHWFWTIGLLCFGVAVLTAKGVAW